MEHSHDGGEREGPAVARPRVLTGRTAPHFAAVVALQRAVGNRTVSRYMPGPPGTPPALLHLMNKTPLEQVKDLLEYGVIDWAVTDDDAARATRMLADMGDAELTVAVGHLDGSPTPYLDRLVGNATLATVRTPGFAKIMGKRAPGRNATLAARLVSYGLLDWEVTPPEAEAAQTLLDALPEADRDRLSEDWIRNRIKANLAKEGDYEQGTGEQLLDGAIQGDFKEDPTFWNVSGQVAGGFIPYAGQVADIRDLLNALDDMFNRQGYSKVSSWINLVLTLVGFVPGVGDAAKALGKGAIKAVKRVAFRVARGLWEAASRHLVEPLLRHLVPEALQKAKARLRARLEERVAKLAESNPHGPSHAEGPSTVAGEGAVPSIAELAELPAKTDSAFDEAAKQAPRRVGDIVSELVHESVESLRRWAEKVFKDLEFSGFELEVKGDDLVLYGIGSKFVLMRANIESVKKFTVRKSESMLTLLRSREARLAAARNAAEEVAGQIRYGAVLVTEEIGERIADLAIKREFKGARIRYTGSGSGSLDRVFELDGVLHIVEAKGGAGRLGSRELGEGLRAVQGTGAYVIDVLLNMAKRGGEEEKIAKELLAKMKEPDKVQLWVSAAGGLNPRTSEEIKVKLMKCKFP